MDEELPEVEKGNKEKEESYRMRKRTLELLPDADSNIAKLQVRDAAD